MQAFEFYKKPGFQLYLGDCLEVMVGMPEASYDMIFADPPYMLSNGGFTVHAGRRVSVHKGDWDKSQGIEKDFEFHQKWIAECRRLLKPNGTIWISGTYHSIYACGLALQLQGFRILNDIAWFKPNAAPNLSGRFFTASHETLIWARKDPKGKHYFDYQAMKHRDWNGDFLKKPGKQMRSVWAIGTPKTEEKKFGKHPTQKPLTLLGRIVQSSTQKGAKILDPFTGSSTTGIAAVMHGRKFVGIDSEAGYLKLSIKRYGDIKKDSRGLLVQPIGYKQPNIKSVVPMKLKLPMLHTP
jgi:site-specific DNA-methyltransferase (adenine-specific)